MRVALLTLLLVVAAEPAAEADRPTPVQAPRAAANAWLATLAPGQRGKAQLPWNSSHRERWDYRPGTRAGLTLREMNAAQVAAAEALWGASLSATGMAEIRSVFERERIQQRQLDPRTRRRNPLWRHPGLYTLAIFGEPGPGRWSWRLGGHHLSIQITFDGDTVVDTTPYVLGGSPVQLRDGQHVMRIEEDLARRFVATLDAAQRRLAMDGRRIPGDVKWPSGTPAVGAVGIAADSLRPAQRLLLQELLRAAIDGPRHAPWSHDVARARFWWRGDERDQWFYLVTPELTFEYRNLGNHLHAVLRRR